MPTVLCFNPGSNSLKFDLVETTRAQVMASQGKRILTGTIENIGRETTLEIREDDKNLAGEKIPAGDFADATQAALGAIAKLNHGRPDLAAVRVVHGGDDFEHAVTVDDDVIRRVEERNELAPLHNPNAIRVIRALREHDDSLRVTAAFDTAFHHSLPEVAWRYPINLEIADRLKIRKFGFHGISHRYQLEQFCHLSDTPIDNANVITTHLESGSSVCAIRNGKSVETSMGFTPLEGIMMGTRSGSVDPAIVPFIMRHECISVDDALNVLEKKSGLLGISDQSLDTRVLRKNQDRRSQLALEMYAYRVRATIGAYLAVLGDARAIVFGGGIGENTPEIRWSILEGLRGWGVVVDQERNNVVMEGDCLLSAPESKLTVWVIHSDEGLQLAHECASVFA
jgi:acetate kinase